MYVFLLQYAYYRGGDVVFRLRDVPKALEALGEIDSVHVEAVHDDGRRVWIDPEDLARPTKTREQVRDEIISNMKANVEALDNGKIMLGHDEIRAQRSKARLAAGDLPKDDELSDGRRVHFGYGWLSPEELDGLEGELATRDPAFV